MDAVYNFENSISDYNPYNDRSARNELPDLIPCDTLEVLSRELFSESNSDLTFEVMSPNNNNDPFEVSTRAKPDLLPGSCAANVTDIRQAFDLDEENIYAHCLEAMKDLNTASPLGYDLQSPNHIFKEIEPSQLEIIPSLTSGVHMTVNMDTSFLNVRSEEFWHGGERSNFTSVNNGLNKDDENNFFNNFNRNELFEDYTEFSFMSDLPKFEDLAELDTVNLLSTDTKPILDDFNISDITSYLNPNELFSTSQPPLTFSTDLLQENEQNDIIEQKHNPDINLIDEKTLIQPILDTSNVQQPPIVVTKRKLEAPRKKIDMKAMKYIIDKEDDDNNEDEDIEIEKLSLSSSKCEEQVDVETISDESITVLEASDPLGLLEQFEASESSTTTKKKLDENKQPIIKHQIGKNLVIVSGQTDSKIKSNDNKNILTNNRINHENINNKSKNDDVKTNNGLKKSSNSGSNNNKTINNNNNNNNSKKKSHIRDSLPQELINRINESGKRKPIPVIPAIPNKKRCTTVNNSSNNGNNNINKPLSKIDKLLNQKNFVNDHDYCAIAPKVEQKPKSIPPPPPQQQQQPQQMQIINNTIKKETSNIVVKESEDERQSLGNQPIIKTDDGKLMVSLLKVNTITNNTAANNAKKRKLNLEEYKKRRPISTTTSQSNSPQYSQCNSPQQQQEQEDEALRRLKHQEKLNQMAAELLKTSPKSLQQQKTDVPVQSTSKATTITPTTTTTTATPTNTTSSPNDNVELVEVIGTTSTHGDLEKIVFCNIGVNTDVSYNKDGLEELQPLLQKVSNKINSNSFITSLIENEVKRKTEPENIVTITNDSSEYIRENFSIFWRKKDRPPPDNVCDKDVQTCISFVDSGISSNSGDSNSNNSAIIIDSSDELESRYRRRNSSEAESISSTSTSTSSSSSSSSSSNDSSYFDDISTTRSSRRARRSSSLNYRQRSSSSSTSSSRSSDSRSKSRSSYSSKEARRKRAKFIQEVEERRVIYVGRLDRHMSKDGLIKLFEKFGPISDASVHEREGNNSFGFVTYVNREDAYEAIEHGNDAFGYQRYDLSFGGRRLFCKTQYSDLDNMPDDEFGYHPHMPSVQSVDVERREEESYEALLRSFQEALRKKRKP